MDRPHETEKVREVFCSRVYQGVVFGEDERDRHRLRKQNSHLGLSTAETG